MGLTVPCGENLHTFKLIVGDLSGDGHGRHSDFHINSNLPREAVEKAYAEACNVLGFDLVKTVCSNYEDVVVPQKISAILKNHGIDLFDYAELRCDNELEIWDISTWAILYLDIIKIVRPDFYYELMTPPIIHIGGYGLFH